MSTYKKFYFRTAGGEQINTTLAPLPDDRGAICGKVIDERSRPVEEALVLLLLSPPEGEPELMSRAYTDDDGHFLFGPLESDKLYLIKVFKNDVKLRELEIKVD